MDKVIFEGKNKTVIVTKKDFIAYIDRTIKNGAKKGKHYTLKDMATWLAYKYDCYYGDIKKHVKPWYDEYMVEKSLNEARRKSIIEQLGEIIENNNELIQQLEKKIEEQDEYLKFLEYKY